MDYKEITDFWFSELEPADWWRKDAKLDQEISTRFGKIWAAACAGELSEWRKNPQGSLSEIIVLDQFSRNMFRDKPQAFAQDSQALTLTQVALEKEFHFELSKEELPFLLMPIMHSESKAVHDKYINYFKVSGLENTYDFEIKHKKIIDEFGRYPHRNKVLKRESTEKEIAFLKTPGSSF
jgi:uncharacterized protein (DUF924 family)